MAWQEYSNKEAVIVFFVMENEVRLVLFYLFYNLKFYNYNIQIQKKRVVIIDNYSLATKIPLQ